jgi:hypothetical protein
MQSSHVFTAPVLRSSPDMSELCPVIAAKFVVVVVVVDVFFDR